LQLSITASQAEPPAAGSQRGSGDDRRRGVWGQSPQRSAIFMIFQQK